MAHFINLVAACPAWSLEAAAVMLSSWQLRKSNQTITFSRGSLCVCVEKGQGKDYLRFFYYCWSNSDPSHEWRVSIEISLKEVKVMCCDLVIDEGLRYVITRILEALHWSRCDLHMHYKSTILKVRIANVTVNVAFYVRKIGQDFVKCLVMRLNP